MPVKRNRDDAMDTKGGKEVKKNVGSPKFDKEFSVETPGDSAESEDISNDLGEGDLVSPRTPVGNQIVTNRGYSGGVQMEELIGAKKIEGPKTKRLS